MTRSRGIRVRRGTRALWAAEHTGKHFCECGCGEPVSIEPVHFNIGIPRFVHGHNGRIRDPVAKPQVECGCGCGQLASPGRRYLSGHNNRGQKRSPETREKISLARRGANNPMYGRPAANSKGGRIRGGTNSRYWAILARSHPFANQRGYVMEHRLLIEEHLRKHDPTSPFLIEVYGLLYLRPEFHVHHIDGDPENNAVENLQVVTPEEHARIHRDDLSSARWHRSPSRTSS